jgi:hypothetical protein
MSHKHVHGETPDLRLHPAARWSAIVVLVVVALATVAGAVRWWPDHAEMDGLRGSVEFATDDTAFLTVPVTEVQPACPSLGAMDPTCGKIGRAHV